MQIKLHQTGTSMCCWKEAESKIDQVHNSHARNVLFNYSAKMETSKLLFAKDSVDLMVRVKQTKKCRKNDQNCIQMQPHWKRPGYGIVIHWLKVRVSTMLQCIYSWAANMLILSLQSQNVEKSNSMNLDLIWYDIWDELSNNLPSGFDMDDFDTK